MEQLAAQTYRRGMSYDWTSTSFQEKKVGYQAYLIYALSLALVYLVLAALYESWTSPAAVIFVVPIAPGRRAPGADEPQLRQQPLHSGRVWS
jgi:HAE1 family hydrophobic/amphiphilic exporter-1